MRKCVPYLYNILIVSFIFISFLVTFQVAPFGQESLLTIDMGQQYIDFFSMYKEAITKDPSLFIYSFQKGLGGEMLGIWTYYLMSPLNLLFLFFEEDNLYMGVILLTYLKLLLASLAFQYFSQKTFKLSTPISIGFSIAYAFMSYNLIYLLNIMWLDGIILLPIIACGLERLFSQGQSQLYVMSLSLAIISNYYIGYMICIFLIMYAGFILLDQASNSVFPNKRVAYGHFILNSFLAGGLASLVWIPAAKALWQSKGQHFELALDWTGQYSVFDILSKLFIGAFSFDEIKYGAPNLFVSSLVILLVIIYFLNIKKHLPQKFLSLAIFIFYGLSFYWQPLNLFWHGGQAPIWYPHRFSFSLTFFGLVLALKVLKDKQASLSKKSIFFATGTWLLIIFLYMSQVHKFDYLSTIKLTISLLFTITYGLVLILNKAGKQGLKLLVLSLLVMEAYTNLNFIMSEFSYVDVDRFVDYVQNLDQAIQGLRHGPNNFYRIDKSYMRTKNEALFSHYNGLDHFSSTLEAKVSDLYAYLGQPSGSGYAAYTNPNLFLDDFLNVRYHLGLNPNFTYPKHFPGYQMTPDANTYDYLSYRLLDQQDRYQVYENPNRLGLAIEVGLALGQSDQALQGFQPIQNLEYLLDLIDPNDQEQPYFKKINLAEPQYDNLLVKDKGDGDFYTYQRIDKSQVATITYQWTFDSSDPYYLSLPSQYDHDNLSFNYDDKPLRLYTPFTGRQLLNAGIDKLGSQHQLKINLKLDSFKANLPELYQFDQDRYDQIIKQVANHRFEVESFKHNHITGKIDIRRDHAYLLFTIPYDSDWLIKLDDKPIKPIPVLNQTLMAIPISQGSHQVELSYRPQALIFAIITSISVGLIYFLYCQWLNQQVARK